MAFSKAHLRRLLSRSLPIAVGIAGAACVGVSAGLGLGIAWAERGNRSPQKVAEFSSSGFVFKDTVEVTAFPDPKACIIFP
ncbi:hypothetical protein CBR_g34616 [Chara braunii]|uniref:Uncharacterized protein n=1 Tax=Chara braunii TaxID=69332 RepID=A0A388LJB3_CHABU|nr:hypothetical protein CBR_g34616 [Chara braunii]|eukprot:GBG82333.1 hypothetical protein CBR_g34616 [Chara braunii]